MLVRRLSLSAGAAAATAAGGKAATAAFSTSSSSPASSASASPTATTSSSSFSPRPPLPRPPKTLSAHLKVYRQLSKARLSALVVATAAAGYVAGSPERVDWRGLGWCSLGTALCSAAANALNQAYEVRTDALMARTAARPLPAGRVSRLHAVAFAGACAAAGVAALLQPWKSERGGGSREAAALGLGNVVLYAAVYTPLKQVHPAATWVGAVVGAVPPLIGWAAASSRAAAVAAKDEVLSSKTEETTQLPSPHPPPLPPAAFVLASGLYFWQLPHFMSLAWLCKEDYARGGHKMLSLADATGKRTAACALRNSLYLMPLGFLAVAAGTATAPFATESAVASGVLAALAAAFWARPSAGTARALFRGSLVHLPVWMGCLLLHRVPNTAENREEQRWERVVERIERGLARGYPEFSSSTSSSSSSSLPEGSRPTMPPLALPGPFLLPPVMPGLGGDRVSWGGLSGVGGGGGGGCPSKAACDREDGGDGGGGENKTEEDSGPESIRGETIVTAASSSNSSSKRWWQVWR